jgi:hypothetical protein
MFVCIHIQTHEHSHNLEKGVRGPCGERTPECIVVAM